jgi:RND family efflux transporter MFP subunit
MLWSGRRVALIAAGLTVAIGLPLRARYGFQSGLSGQEIETVKVVRVDLEQVVVASGDIAGGKQTEIECELENLSATGEGGLRIIQLAPNGARVAKDDVLCRFDSSLYEEAARQKELALQQALTELRVAELDLETATVALKAYHDGEAVQVESETRGQIALSRSDLQTAREHLAWSRRMRAIGYVPSTQVANDEYTVLSLENSLASSVRALSNHLRFTVPKTLADLQAKVDAQREKQSFAQIQKANTEERLENLHDLVKKCTIRAPHDGTLVHAAVLYGVDDWTLHEGSIVYQGQPLFFLPERSHLVADISLHESVAARVKVGMRATVRIPALPNQWVDGKVERIDQLPSINYRAGLDVQHFPARVTLAHPSESILPGMSAEVHVIIGVRRDVLVVPVESVLYDHDRAFCRVVKGSEIRTSPISVRAGNARWLEVVSGVSEGDEVVLKPVEIDETGDH